MAEDVEKVPEELSDGLFIFHNPNAKIKLPLEMFKNTNAVQMIMKNGTLESFEGNSQPLVSRLNLQFYPKSLIPQLCDEVFLRFNPRHKKSYFLVEEIDLEISPKEITLKDINNHFYIIDLSDEDVELINENEIHEGDTIYAIIETELNEYGQTAIWRFFYFSKIE